MLILLLFSGFTGFTQKTAVHWYRPTISLNQAEAMANYDLLIVDPECIFNSRESLSWLKLNNPRLKILCYFNPPEWFDPMFSDKPWSIKMVNVLQEQSSWWLRDTAQNRISFWQGMYTMNCTFDCPKYLIEGQEQGYIEFITQRFIQDVLKQYPFDGVLIDNLWDQINWLGRHGFNQGGIDRDGDQQRDDSVTLNTAWKRGLSYCLKEIRTFGGKNFIIIGNPANLSYAQCDGKMFENFPDIYTKEDDKKYEGWYYNLNYASSMSGPCIFNARPDNYFFTLCSSILVDNAYFSDQQNKAYEDKYRLLLGPPLSKAKVFDSGYTRQFENGEVFVNPGGKNAWIIYQDGKRRNQ